MFNMFATHQILHFTIILFILSLQTIITCFATTFLPQELLKGFSAVPLSTPTSFQPLLTDSTGNFSLGFLRHNQNDLQLAVVHVPSSEPFWIANPTRSASWSDTTRLFFNGSLVLWDSQTGASWSTSTNGNRVILLNTSNLQVQNKDKDKDTPLWESFHFPTNTLVEDQNLTATMSLVSSNKLYSLQLSDTFMGLYANYNEEKQASLSKRLLYWKRTPLEAKAEIIEGQGPIYARVSNEGYLGMYQTSTKPIDVQKFNTFQQTSSFLVVRLEPDGNLKGYYWDVAKSTWQLNYQAITETCDLPNPCGSYGLCTPGGPGCSCIDNKTRFESGEPGGCLTGEKDNENETVGNLCGKGISTGENSYRVMRRNGVEAPHKELLGHVTTSSLAECEGLCEKNCSCWGAMYSNATGVCYILEYPIRSMLGSGDESKVGYFKVRKGAEKKNKVGIVVSVLVGIVVFVVVIIGVGIWVVRLKRRKRMMKVVEENGASPGPYRNLGSASFRSIEMCSNGNGE